MAELGEIGIFRNFYYNSIADLNLFCAINYWFEYDKIKKLNKINKTKTGENTKSLMMKKFNYIDNFMQKARDYKD